VEVLRERRREAQAGEWQLYRRAKKALKKICHGVWLNCVVVYCDIFARMSRGASRSDIIGGGIGPTKVGIHVTESFE
jgi:hypothetical protein